MRALTHTSLALLALLMLGAKQPDAAPPSQRLQALAEHCWADAVAQPEAALRALDPAIAESALLGLARTHAELRLCRGYAQEQLQRPAPALQDYEFGVAEGQRLNAATLQADALSLRGEARYLQGLYSQALTDLKRAYEINVTLKRAAQQNYALNAIANLYADANVGDYDRAIDYYRQLLKRHEADGAQQEIATAHYNLGSTLERKQDYAAALEEFRQAEALERRRQQPLEAAYVQRSIGTVLGKLGRAAEALPILEQALKVFEAAGHADRAAQTRLSHAVVLRQLGRLREALAELEQVREYFERERSDRFLEKIHDERALTLSGLGEWPRALRAREQQLALVRRLAEQAKSQQTSRLRVEFDSARKEQENRELNAENLLRSQALASAQAIQHLQLTALALGTVALLALVALGLRQRSHAQRMRTLAMTDELTRLPNRRHLQMLAEAQLAAAQDGGTPLAVLALDIDHFKRINDQHGHDAGDQVLRRVAAAAQAVLRRNDVLGRTGGEEFVALLPGASAEVAMEVAERMRAAVAALQMDEIAPGLRASISLGVSPCQAGERALHPVLKRADAALYRAKAAGRNMVVLA